MTAVYDFAEQLRQGVKAEAVIAKRFGWRWLRGRGPDFKTPGGVYVELKADTRASTDTGNLFIERWGDFDKRTPGGPWKARRDRCVGFLYFFQGDRQIYGFKTEELIKHLEENPEQYRERRIANKGWTTVGYLVPLWSVVHLAKRNTL